MSQLSQDDSDTETPSEPEVNANQSIPSINLNRVYKRMPFIANEVKKLPTASMPEGSKLAAPVTKLYEDETFKNTDFTPYQWNYKKDEAEQGWAPGMDDLARIILDNNGVVKFNKNLTTQAGAVHWVQKKNLTVKPGKEWRVVVKDLNNDGENEILIIDGRGDVRYLDGYHIGKSKLNLHKMHQVYIDANYGHPEDIRKARALGQIAKGQLSMRNFINTSTRVNPDDPNGPLIILNDNLTKIGYKSRSLNPCNLFMKYITKPIWDAHIERTDGDDNFSNYDLFNETQKKLTKKFASIIKLNASLYTKYIANVAQKQLAKEGYSDKAMKKKDKNQEFSPFSKRCGDLIYNIVKNEDGAEYQEIKNYIWNALNKAADHVAVVEVGQYFGEPAPKIINKRLAHPRQPNKEDLLSWLVFHGNKPTNNK